MKKTCISSILLLLVLVVSYTPETKAASQNECAIWLCLPTGFPSGCSSAKSAFKKRIKKGKSPLPSLGSCIVSSPIPIGDESEMSSQDGIAAYIPEHQECLLWKTRRVNSRRDETYCAQEITVPTKVQRDTTCHISRNRDGETSKSTPAFCTQTIRYVDVYVDGVPIGPTYYFDGNGNEFQIPE